MSVQNWEVGTVMQLALGSGCQSVAAPAAATEKEEVQGKCKIGK